MWACLVKGFNTLITAGVLNLPDKRVDPDCLLRSGFESPRRQLGFKPLSGSYHLRTLHCRATLICASFVGLIIYYHFPFFFHLSFYLILNTSDVSIPKQLLQVVEMYYPLCQSNTQLCEWFDFYLVFIKCFRAQSLF